MKYTNNFNLPLPIQVWLTRDTYDYSTNPKQISATSLLKPIKQLVLNSRVPYESKVTDLSDLIPSRIGTAIHDSIESSWKSPIKAMEALGIPSSVLGKVCINPPREARIEGLIPIYMEQRSIKEISGYKISGKFDFIYDGQILDFKSTGTYSYINQSNRDKYILQGSIYRWLNQDIVTQDIMQIIYIFTDWSKQKSIAEKDYPKCRIITQPLKLLSLQETENYIKSVISKFERYKDTDEESIPYCTDEELWVTDSSFAYYKNPDKLTRSTKNFNNYSEAYAKYLADGSKGIIIERKSEVKACRYCNALSICKQAKSYIQEGRLFI
jgi:hypothetical protein